jgi:voltage-gated potassium channel
VPRQPSHAASASAAESLQRTLDAPGRAWRALEAAPLEHRRLYYGRRPSARRTLLLRAALAFALVAIVTLVFVLQRSGLRDGLDGQVSIADAIYFSLITLTTVGYGDIVPVTTSARLVDAFLVSPIRLLVWAIFVGTAYQFVVQRIVEDVRMRMRQADLAGHVVVCGFGLGGRSAVAELLRRGAAPDGIVVVDASEAAVLEAAEQGLVGLRGDATRERVLMDARVGRARVAMVSLGRDDTTVLSVLTLRALAPELRIVAMVKEAENERLVRQGGASATVCPSTLSGVLMANSLDSSRIPGYVHDMLTIDGRVMIEERAARAEDVGRRPTELADGIAVRIHRGDTLIGFWDPQATIEAGDQLLVLTPRRAD